MLGVFWCFGSKSTCPYCWGEGWGWWQHGENDVFVPFALLTGQKKAESPIRLPNWPIHPRCDVNMLVFLMVCFGAVPLIYFVFPNHQVWLHHSRTCYTILEFPMFSAWTTPPVWGFCNSLFYSESCSSSVLNVCGLSASLPTGSMACWPAGFATPWSDCVGANC